MSRRRILLGFLIAPGMPGVVAGLVAVMLGSELAALAFMLAFLAYIAAAVVGVPAYLYARTRGLAALKRATVLATNIGLAAYVLITGFVTLMNALASPFHAIMNFLAALVLLLVPLLYVAAAVWLFWRISLRGAESPFAH